MAAKDRMGDDVQKGETGPDSNLLEGDEADAQDEDSVGDSVKPEIGGNAVEEHYKGPVRYHLTLKARDLYLLVFGSALVIFAAFTLGAIVGRHLGPSADQQVTAMLERQDLFKEGKAQTVEPTPVMTERAVAPSHNVKHKAPSKPEGGSSEPFQVKKGKKLLSLITTPIKSPKATPKPRVRHTPKAVARAKASPKPTRKARQVPKKRVKAAVRKKTSVTRKASRSTQKRSMRTYYSAQVGAFKRLANAKREVRNLKRRGFQGWIKPPTKRVHFYLVLVGKEKSAAKRASIVRRLRKAGYKTVLLKTFHERR